MRSTYLTPEELKERCPAGYAELLRQNAEDPTLTPIDELTLWVDANGVFCLQDPADNGFSNITVTWEGDCWC